MPSKEDYVKHSQSQPVRQLVRDETFLCAAEKRGAILLAERSTHTRTISREPVLVIFLKILVWLCNEACFFLTSLRRSWVIESWKRRELDRRRSQWVVDALGPDRPQSSTKIGCLIIALLLTRFFSSCGKRGSTTSAHNRSHGWYMMFDIKYKK